MKKIILSLLFFSQTLMATTLMVTTTDDSGPGSLRAAMLMAGSGDTIMFDPDLTGSIYLDTGLPPIDIDLSIMGNSQVTIDGNGSNQIFVVKSGNVLISDVGINNGRSQGGNGGGSFSGNGGGGMGAGGALFIGKDATCTLSNVDFENNSAIGGNGGNESNIYNASAGGGGGGGMNGGDGGQGGFNYPNGSGGGGGGGHEASGGNGKAAGGGAGGYEGEDGQNATNSKGGDGGGSGGTGGANGDPGQDGSNATEGGGGGGVAGVKNASGGTSQYGGGDGGDNGGSGGGGAGLGGAVFVTEGGTLILDNVKWNGNQAIGGEGANHGKSEGQDLFAMLSTTVTYKVQDTTTLHYVGRGNVEKTGDGTLHIHGHNTHEDTGDVTPTISVVEGTVVLRGDFFATRTSVEENGTLKGNANHANIENRGIIKPGESIGVISVVNNFVQEGSGHLYIEIDPDGSHDWITIGQQAFLDGKLHITPNYGTYFKGREYPFFATTEGISGKFANWLIEGQSGLEIDLFQGEYDLCLTVMKNVVGIEMGDVGGNEERVRANLEELIALPDSDLESVILALNDLDVPEFVQALNELEPSVYGTLPWATASDISQVNSRLINRSGFLCLKCPCSCTGSGIWIDPIGQITKQRDSGELEGYHSNMVGVVGGVDTRIGQYLALGVAGGYTNDHIKWRHSLGSCQAQTGYFGAYTQLCRPLYAANLSFVVGREHYHTHRSIPFLDRKAKSSHHATSALIHGGLGINWNPNCFQTQGLVSLDYIYANQDKLRERGADSMNLCIQKHHTHFLKGEVGGVVKSCLQLNLLGTVIPTFRLSYVFLSPLSHHDLRAHFEEEWDSFAVTTTNRTLNFVSPSAGLTFCGSDGRSSFVVLYSGEFGSNRTRNEIDLSFRYNF